ncbi:hypothetical protein DNTS_004232 [Danionella cerebrum]|uniref:Uncharacterized protein n=1 Tax=Danionella cerebrum TaxID=2873325 RepID=A0A553Q9Y6_9TELE|nr:hypothetical protein DNTS_004232 [Danionella translucida]
MSAPGFEAEAASHQEHPRLQLMYFKDQVYQGDREFSLEELRAQRYFKALSDKALEQVRIKRDLQLQIEQQKKKLLQQRTSSADAQQIVHEKPDLQMSKGLAESASSAPARLASFQRCELEDGRAQPWSSKSQEKDRIQGGSYSELKNTAENPLRTSEENLQMSRRSLSSNLVSLRLPILSLKPQKPTPAPSTEKDASLSRSEEAIIDGHCNKTMCVSPNSTREFAGAAQLASTPFNASERLKLPAAEDKNSKVVTTESAGLENKLSTILEISREWGGMSFSTLSKDPPPRSPSHQLEKRGSVDKGEDFFSEGVRSQIFHQMDVASIKNLHRMPGSMPDIRNIQQLDGEQLVYFADLESLEGYSQFWTISGLAILKVAHSLVAWDFLLLSRLLSHGSAADLQEVLEEPVDALDAVKLVVLLLELLQDFHRCRMRAGRAGFLSLCGSGSSEQPHICWSISFCSKTHSAGASGVDLLAVAEISHSLLFGQPMKVRKEDSGWNLEENCADPIRADLQLPLKQFFHMILNPEKPPELLLSELMTVLKNVVGSLFINQDCDALL